MIALKGSCNPARSAKNLIFSFDTFSYLFSILNTFLLGEKLLTAKNKGSVGPKLMRIMSFSWNRLDSYNYH